MRLLQLPIRSTPGRSAIASWQLPTLWALGYVALSELGSPPVLANPLPDVVLSGRQGLLA